MRLLGALVLVIGIGLAGGGYLAEPAPTGSVLAQSSEAFLD